MKKMLVITIIISAVMLLLPLSVIGKETEKITEVKIKSSQSVEKTAKKTVFKVFDSSDNTIYEMEANEYIFGVVAAEMPALYNEEALKAQAVAAYTFAYTKSIANKDLEYDITTDFNIDQAFIKRENAREKWGDNADEYEKKIDNAVKSVEGLMITYNKEPITAVYHAVSSGKTESSKNVWGSERAYLQPVLSEWDKLYENYSSKESFTLSELKEKLGGIKLTGKEEEIFGEALRTESGSVNQITVSGEKIAGETIRKALNLKSRNFSIEYKDGAFIFTVLGYGHGVGMSQV